MLACVGLAGAVTGQTVRTWSSNSDQRWNRNANWSGNQPNTGNEIARFGTGSQLNPELNANNLTVRGIQFSAGASSYAVGDDNGARTLRIGNGSTGFIETLASVDQTLSIANLQFQNDGTISTLGSGGLAISSNLTGTNRDLTFNANGNISIGGNITTGAGTLAKLGAGTLSLSGSNTYTGQTTVNAGALLLGASNVFADSSHISIASGATLGLNDLSDIIGRVSGSGAVDFGQTGTGQLTLGSGTSAFGGSFLGIGELVIGAGATLTLGADFNNAGLNLTLAGGTLRLSGHDLTFGALHVTGNSIIDFSSGNSALSVASLGFSDANVVLTAQNWANAADFFYSGTSYTQGAAPLNQVVFEGWDADDTKWQSYDSQITPVPEPRAYGALFILVAGLLVWRRKRRALK
jgi:autotransporter-associated beta strand protein